MPDIVVKRIYDVLNEEDGYRVLVDRFWPRGVTKAKANLNGWAKDISPSNDLRKWFGHRPDRFEEFKRLYLEELRSDERKREKIIELVELGKSQKLTLLYGAKDSVHNHAVVLREELLHSLNGVN
ncbi:Uncharacterized conserved protein YeaO, DUF488 family [Mesobacillus persicus]|uniref:Uncharacterized conserved protein YeaO, DUF488 family n=1 Tax=Mesobacillus persicus TaxID=930146 RepID=A0A1H8JA27_9BACI|nr:DUF488 family protein [Mesobacillus persicus]SEN77471.1 Uncharacterized conserved protein YeaO, DUF488 family [Mesobacillus persicus]